MSTTQTADEEQTNALLKRTLEETDVKREEDSNPLHTDREESGAEDDNDAASSSDPAKAHPANKRSKTSNKGRHGDPRMHRAVAARLLNPELSLLEALLEGGFVFPEGTEGSGKSDRNIYDSDGVLLCQRKNQLSRRLRLAKKRQQASRAEGNIFSAALSGRSQGGDTRTLQNMLLNGQLPIAGSEIPMITPHHFAPPFFPTQATQMDSSILNGSDSRGNKMQGIDSGNLDQYIQQTARSMGLRPEQFTQSLRNYQNQAMFSGFPGSGMPFQSYPGMPNQGGYMPPPPPPQQHTADQQQNSGTNSSNNASQNMQVPPPSMMSMQQQHDINRMLFNRSLLMNVMGQQQLQQQQQQHLQQQQNVTSLHSQDGTELSPPQDDSNDPSSGVKDEDVTASETKHTQEIEETTGSQTPTSFSLSAGEENGDKKDD